MTIQHVHEHLEEYVLGWLDPETQAQVEEHLASCAECRAQADAYEETLATLPEALARVSSHIVPANLRDRVIARAVATPEVMAQEGYGTFVAEPIGAVPSPPVTTPTRVWAMPQLRLRLAF